VYIIAIYNDNNILDSIERRRSLRTIVRLVADPGWLYAAAVGIVIYNDMCRQDDFREVGS
jgi:hypothetical protein